MKTPFVLAILIAVGCASTPPGDTVPARAQVPYASTAPSPHNLEIRLDSGAARDILAALSRPAYESADAAALQSLPAVRLAIQDASRNAEIFERDFAAAFAEEAKAAVFDFRGVRADRERWTKLLETISAGETDLVRRAAESAATLLPDDRPISMQLQVLLSFGLGGLADHVLVPAADDRYVMIVDLARALGDSTSEPPENQRARLSRLIAGGAYRQAWSAYRETSPEWQKPDSRLGQIEPLLRVVAEAGPVALFSVDENFFPLSVWLKEPMKRNIGELNRMAEILSDAETDLDHRMNLTAEIRRPEFSRRLAGTAGAFLSDVIIQTDGVPAFRKALAAGPRAFFAAYDRAAESQRDLIALSRVIQERVRDTPAR